jgi:hypothetical protein
MEIIVYCEDEITRLEAQAAALREQLAAVLGGIEAYKDVLRELRGKNKKEDD